jgi:hypothetical protein
LAVAERAIYDCTRRAGSLGAPPRNVMVMLSPFAVWSADINAASSYTTRIDLRKKVSLVMHVRKKQAGIHPPVS